MGVDLRCILVAALCASTPALAQASRTWVSGVGDDANPCSRTAPCRTFASAIAKTAAGGEIDVLDPGDFGTVTITKAITIDGGHDRGRVLAAGGPAITVAAGAQDVVVLRRLSLLGTSATPGTTGITFDSGRLLHVERSRIQGFEQDGLRFAPEAGGQLVVDDVVASGNGGAGVRVGGTTGAVTAVISRGTFTGNRQGLWLGAGSTVTVNALTASDNTEAGIWARTDDGGKVQLNVERARLTHNGVGLHAASVGGGSQTLLRLSRAAVDANVLATTRLIGTGTVLSFGNNRMAGGSSPTCPTGAVLLEDAALPGLPRGGVVAPVELSVLGAMGTVTSSVTGALPRGVQLEGGVLAGTVEEGGDFPFTVTATDGNGCSASRDFTLSVACPPMSLEPATLAAGTTGQTYSETPFEHVGGEGETTFVVDGALPRGLHLAHGVLTGMPTQPGTFPFTLTATDGGRCAASRSYILDIARSADFQEATLEFQVSANPTHDGDPVSVTARVVGGVGEPSGTVTFLNGTEVLEVVTLKSREATHTLARLAPGKYTLGATYSGDALFGGLDAAPVTLEVLPREEPPVTPPVEDNDKSCGCQQSGAPGGALLTLLLLVLNRRRRRAPTPG
ncbi:putative Ig domain-containing protein [Myxococcus sp. K15C18031901]|uniref:putative Ig domain-containing protein n=1 Tax=Myxococcus dinghuensis TaxID=2906761 RepID=UPI0020A7AE0D|nr:putative Ig domain-containing protein [Myxococcus dinghuensis]MCP3100173.1 putative Ig domain-containing protein [Myxococcus dinghuensis]